MNHSIYFRYKSKFYIRRGTSQTSDNYIATIVKSIERYGYTFSEDLCQVLKTQSIEDLTIFYFELEEIIKKEIGADVKYEPMYPGFPKQVMDLDTASLYLNAIYHYISLDVPVFDEDVKKRLPLMENFKLKIIRLGTFQEFNSIFVDLLSSQIAVSEQNRLDLEWYVQFYEEDIVNLIPKAIPNKENLAHFSGILIKHLPYQTATKIIAPYIKTAVDVLRVATSLSEGDVTLLYNTKFAKFNRNTRRFLLSLLENTKQTVEDMFRDKKRWIRLGEILHPSEYAHKYPNVFQAFQQIRNQNTIPRFSAWVEMGLLNKDYDRVSELLAQRPGEFARRLDLLLRKSKDWTDIVLKFESIADNVSATILLQLIAHFSKRKDYIPIRSYFLKGVVANVKIIDKQLSPLASDICDSIVNVCKNKLIQRFRSLPSLGSVYLDPRLKNYTVPFANRSASKALWTVSRGSKIEIPNQNVIRFFLWWKEGIVNNVPTNRVDIDLSAVIYDNDWKYVEHISYTHLRSQVTKSAHSGDITSAPNGACEFIDLNLPMIRQYGGRYVVTVIFSFMHIPFCNLPECFAGWMIRSDVNSGEIFEPASVQNKLDITSDTSACIPVILDLQENHLIWADAGIENIGTVTNNLESNNGKIIKIAKSLTNLIKPNLFDLFELHAKGRGTIVSQEENADTIFSIENGVTPYQIELISSQYL